MNDICNNIIDDNQQRVNPIEYKDRNPNIDGYKSLNDIINDYYDPEQYDDSRYKFICNKYI